MPFSHPVLSNPAPQDALAPGCGNFTPWLTSAGEAAAGEAAPSSRVATYTVRTAMFQDPDVLRIWPARIPQPRHPICWAEGLPAKAATPVGETAANELVHPPAAKIPQT